MTRLISNDRRLRNLERGHGYRPPMHLPMQQWTDEEICLYVSGGRRRCLTGEEMDRCIREAPDQVLEVLAGDRGVPIPPPG